MNYRIRSTLMNYKVDSYGKDSQNKEDYSFNTMLDCSLGTNPFGVSKLINKQKDILKEISISDYPKPYGDFKKTLMNYWSESTRLKEENIVFAGGAIDSITKINKLFIENASTVLGCAPQFPDYSNDVKSLGGVYDAISLKKNMNYKFNPEEILSNMSTKYSLIHIDNPNNPTGQSISLDAIKKIVTKAKSMDICVVVDEAYGDFLDKAESAITLINEFDNLIVIRSFSKGMGLAGLRIGYIVTSEKLAHYYEKVNVPFTINTVGHFLGKIVLQDEDFLEESKEKIRILKQSIINSCNRLKVLATDHRVPIMVLEHPNENVDLCEEFKKNGIITVSGRIFENLDQNHVRVRVPQESKKLIEAIKNIEKSKETLECATV